MEQSGPPGWIRGERWDPPFKTGTTCRVEIGRQIPPFHFGKTCRVELVRRNPPFHFGTTCRVEMGRQIPPFHFGTITCRVEMGRQIPPNEFRTVYGAVPLRTCMRQCHTAEFVPPVTLGRCYTWDASCSERQRSTANIVMHMHHDGCATRRS